MNNIREWSVGLNNFQKYKQETSVTLEGHSKPHNLFTVKLIEQDYNQNRNIDDIFYDHLSVRPGNVVEVCFSGGLDSELLIKSCINLQIPVVAVTMALKLHGALVNVSDMYYAEKFCRENNIKHYIYDLDVVDFFEGEKYLEYLTPYKIVEPHVATQYWILEQCKEFPVMGGYWPWVQCNLPEKIISPYSMSYNMTDLFMKDKGITGIGNMISYSFESVCHFIKLQIINHDSRFNTFDTIPFLKTRMYKFNEPRIRGYGWEAVPNLFNFIPYKMKLINLFGKESNKIIWGDQIGNILNTTKRENSKF